MNQRFLALAGAAATIAAVASACSLPRVPSGRPSIPTLPQTSLVFDDHGRLITTLHAGENRTLIPLGQVPVLARDAVVAIEDSGFYSHHGVDLKAIVRAAYQDARQGRIVQGGSTITEQLVKITMTGGDQALGRKVREAILAYRLENQLSKDRILEMYLNTVYFGQGAYGIEAAAKTFFSEPAQDLSLAQGALLAGLLASPAGYDPVFHPAAALARRNQVLERMRRLGVIDRGTFAAATKEELGLRLEEQSSPYPAPYFVDYVKRWFLNDPRFGATFADRYDLLFRGGLRIFTTVDLAVQREAERAVNAILAYRSDPYGAMTVIDPRTGAIRAMVGGRDWFSRTDPFAQLNLATGGATGRQAGSAFKPFALVAALEHGIQPSRIYPAPSHIDITLPPGFGAPTWAVENYDGASGGNLTLEQATIDSVNTVYAQLIMEVSPSSVVRTARAMGITSVLHPVPSAVLGANEVNTLEMASAYGTLATLGKEVPPMAVTSITDASGRSLYRADPQPRQVIQPSVAWAADQILEKVIQEGTGTAANIGRPEAGKTGTAERWTNAWFVGFIPQLVAGVWVGFPQGQIPMEAPRTRLPQVLGGTWPAQIWHAFMVNATRGMPVEDFPKPTVEYVSVRMDITRGCVSNPYTLPKDVRIVRYVAGTEPNAVCTTPTGPQDLSVPSVVGLPQAQAERSLTSYAFTASVLVQSSNAVPAGTVLSESPAPGTIARQGTQVTLVVAGAAAREPTPSTSPPSSPSPTPSLAPSPT